MGSTQQIKACATTHVGDTNGVQRKSGGAQRGVILASADHWEQEIPVTRRSVCCLLRQGLVEGVVSFWPRDVGKIQPRMMVPVSRQFAGTLAWHGFAECVGPRNQPKAGIFRVRTAFEITRRSPVLGDARSRVWPPRK